MSNPLNPDVAPPATPEINIVYEMIDTLSPEGLFNSAYQWMSSGSMLGIAMIVFVVVTGLRLVNFQAGLLSGSQENFPKLLVELVATLILISLYQPLMQLAITFFDGLKDLLPMGDVQLLAQKLDKIVAKHIAKTEEFPLLSFDGAMFLVVWVMHFTSVAFLILVIAVLDFAHAALFSIFAIMGYLVIVLHIAHPKFRPAGGWFTKMLVLMLWPVIDVIMVKFASASFMDIINDPKINAASGYKSAWNIQFAMSILNVMIACMYIAAPFVTRALVEGGAGAVVDATKPFIGGAIAGAAMSYKAAQTATNYSKKGYRKTRSFGHSLKNSVGKLLGDSKDEGEGNPKSFSNKPSNSGSGSSGSEPPPRMQSTGAEAKETKAAYDPKSRMGSSEASPSDNARSANESRVTERTSVNNETSRSGSNQAPSTSSTDSGSTTESGTASTSPAKSATAERANHARLSSASDNSNAHPNTAPNPSNEATGKVAVDRYQQQQNSSNAEKPEPVKDSRADQAAKDKRNAIIRYQQSQKLTVENTDS